MIATKYSIAEQVLLRITGGRPDQATKIDIRDIMAAVPQVLSALISADYYKRQLPSGETIPDSSMMATYNDIPVVQYGSASKAQLPALPIRLPRSMGLWEIFNPSDPSCTFIPALPGQIQMVKGDRTLSCLSNMVIYEQAGREVIFSKNLLADSIEKVSMRLIISDVNTLGENDPLPVPPDMESDLVDNLFSRFAQLPQAEKDTDVLTTNKAR